MSEGLIVFVIFVAIIVFAVGSYFFPFGLWISAIASGLSVSPFTLIAMRLRKINPYEIITPAIMLDKAGIKIDMSQLESHYLAGGRVSNVAAALIAAQKAGINLSFQKATAIDLAGRDVRDAVSLCVKPKVINTPLVAAMAKNGIQVKAIARVTVKADINKLVGGATEETILARVGEGIVTTIGSAESHEEILENRDNTKEGQ